MLCFAWTLAALLSLKMVYSSLIAALHRVDACWRSCTPDSSRQCVNVWILLAIRALGLAMHWVISGSSPCWWPILLHSRLVIGLFHHLFLRLINLLLIVFLKIEDDLLNRLVNECSSFIGLGKRQLLCGWCNWHAQRLPSLLGHVEVWVAGMKLHLLFTHKFPILFELSNNIESLWRGYLSLTWRELGLLVIGCGLREITCMILACISRARECMSLIEAWDT